MPVPQAQESLRAPSGARLHPRILGGATASRAVDRTSLATPVSGPPATAFAGMTQADPTACAAMPADRNSGLLASAGEPT